MIANLRVDRRFKLCAGHQEAEQEAREPRPPGRLHLAEPLPEVLLGGQGRGLGLTPDSGNPNLLSFINPEDCSASVVTLCLLCWRDANLLAEASVQTVLYLPLL